LLASKISGDLQGPLDEELLLAVWGRSPAARWRLYIEQAVMDRSRVDLSGLSGIELAITYRSL
jgi:hypothetical protein